MGVDGVGGMGVMSSVSAHTAAGECYGSTLHCGCGNFGRHRQS